jgi:hypothetical protein
MEITMSTATSAGADYTVPPNVKGSGASNNHGAATRVGSSSSNFTNVSTARTQRELHGSTVIDGENTDEALSASVIAYNNQRPVGMRVSSTVSGQSNTALLSGANVPGAIRSIHKREAYKVNKIATAYRNGYWNPSYGKFQTYGTYSRTGFTVTVTAARHGLASNDYVYLDFTSGAATDGRFQVTVSDANTFTVTHTATGSTTGNVTVKGPAYGTESPGTDTAATPTRANPGQLTYKGGAPLPVTNNDYKAKTG